MGKFTLRPLENSDSDWVTQRMIESWGAETVVAHATIYHPAQLPGFAALDGEEIIGLLTYTIAATDCEIVTLNVWRAGSGVGTALIETVKEAAVREGCLRLWLITTNDNLHALRFYQRRGFVISAIHINAVEKSRLLKPEIPLTGENGIPIRDEIELEIWIKK
jgi:ribosomal protein S18 acetylase RimI-like enzyme